MGKEEFLADEELTVNPNDEPSGIFVSIGGNKSTPKKEKKHKKHDGKRAVTADEILDLLANASDDVIECVKAAFEQPAKEEPSASAVVAVEGESRFAFDGEHVNDNVAIVEIVDEEAEKRKRLTQLRTVLHLRYCNGVRAKAKAEKELHEPTRKSVYINALNAQNNFLWHVLMQTSDDEWLTKVVAEIKTIGTSSPGEFIANADAYATQFGCPKDMEIFIVRRYLTEYFYTKRKFVEEVLKHPGDEFKQKLSVFMFRAKQKTEEPKPTPKPVSKPAPKPAPKPVERSTTVSRQHTHTVSGTIDWSRFANAVHGALRGCVR